jgi:hypothetical protein
VQVVQDRKAIKADVSICFSPAIAVSAALNVIAFHKRQRHLTATLTEAYNNTALYFAKSYGRGQFPWEFLTTKRRYAPLLEEHIAVCSL